MDGIELYRLARAIHLDVERVGLPGIYWVSGGERRHFVNVLKDECDCWDRSAGNYCKHLLRAMLAEGDDAILKRLRWFVPMPRSRRRLPAKV